MLTNLLQETGIEMSIEIIREKYDTEEKCIGVLKELGHNTKTLVPNSKIPLTKWFLAIPLIVESRLEITAYKLAKEIDITRPTAKRMIEIMQHQSDLIRQEKNYEIDLSLYQEELENTYKPIPPSEKSNLVLATLIDFLISLPFFTSTIEKSKIENPISENPPIVDDIPHGDYNLLQENEIIV